MPKKQRNTVYTLWRILVFWPAIIIVSALTIYANKVMGNSFFYNIVEIPLFFYLMVVIDTFVREA